MFPALTRHRATNDPITSAAIRARAWRASSSTNASMSAPMNSFSSALRRMRYSMLEGFISFQLFPLSQNNGVFAHALRFVTVFAELCTFFVSCTWNVYRCTWLRGAESNCLLRAYETRRLPVAYTRNMVWMEGFEPSASCFQSRPSNQADITSRYLKRAACGVTHARMVTDEPLKLHRSPIHASHGF